MSAAEIIEQIKRLPPEEKRTVREFVTAEPSPQAIKYADNTSFQEAADEVFQKYDNLLRKLAQ